MESLLKLKKKHLIIIFNILLREKLKKIFHA